MGTANGRIGGGRRFNTELRVDLCVFDTTVSRVNRPIVCQRVHTQAKRVATVVQSLDVQNGARMKVVLLALSGDSAREKLAQLYPDASIETITRTEFETGGLRQRLAALRARRPDVFAIATERLSWQRGQNLFMIFGALAGAREVVMIDSHGASRTEARVDLLAGAPAALAEETVAGLMDLLTSRRELLSLEHQKYRSK